MLETVSTILATLHAFFVIRASVDPRIQLFLRQGPLASALLWVCHASGLVEIRSMKIWCVDRELEEPRAFEFSGETPPPMLALTEVVHGMQRLREFELVRSDADTAVYVETSESAKRWRLAA